MLAAPVTLIPNVEVDWNPAPFAANTSITLRLASPEPNGKRNTMPLNGTPFVAVPNESLIVAK